MQRIGQRPGRVNIQQLLAIALLAALLVTAAGCQDGQVQGDYRNPYTRSEIEDMMAYHGTLVARFDGRQWWFLTGSQWMRLENARARDYAMFPSNKATPSTLF